jgi:hypothetical protein
MTRPGEESDEMTVTQPLRPEHSDRDADYIVTVTFQEVYASSGVAAMDKLLDLLENRLTDDEFGMVLGLSWELGDKFRDGSGVKP